MISVLLLLVSQAGIAQADAAETTPAAVEIAPQAEQRESLRHAEEVIADGVEFLLRTQAADGSWGGPRRPMIYDGGWPYGETHRSWQYAVTSLCCMSLLDAPASPRRDDRLNAGFDFLTSSDAILRISDWDTDNTWAYVYGLAAMTKASAHPYFADSLRRVAIQVRGRQLLEQLLGYQSPNGGWGYYDDEATTMPPQWGTSFMTAVALLGLLEAEELGWEIPEKARRAAVSAIERSRLPDGSYTYTVEVIPALDGGVGIDNVRGSLSRIQVCNLALWRAQQAGVELRRPMTREDLRLGLSQLFREHHYLDIARGRPYPHEAYHYNSGYFYFFGHYYAGEVLALLGEDGAPWFSALVREIAKTQAEDGSMIDYLMNDYGRPYGVAYGIGALLQARTVFSD